MKGKRLLQILFLCLVLTLLTVTALAAGDGTDVNSAVATIGENQYPSLEEALAAAVDDDTIVLQQDVALTQGIDVDKLVTLDLSGYTISNDETWNGGDYLVAVKRGGELTVTDSSDPSTGQIITEGDDILCAVKMTVLGEAANGEPAALTVEGGAISGYAYGISGNGNRHDTYVEIGGGTVQSQAADSIAIYQPQFGILDIFGGTIQSPNTAIEIRAGSLNVYGDAIIQGGNGEPVVNPNGNGGTTTNTGIAVAQHATQHQITVDIEGGQISGGAALYESNPQGNDGSSSVIITIEGDAALTGDLISSGFGETTVTGGQIDGDVTYSGTGQLLLQENAKVTGGVVNDGATGALAILDSTVAGAVTGDANIVNSSVNGVPTTNVSEDAVARVGARFYDSLDAAVTAPESLNQTVYLLQSAELTVEPDSISSLDVLPGAVLTAKDPTLMTTFVNIATGGGLVMPNSEGALETFVGSGDDARVRLTAGGASVFYSNDLRLHVSLNEDSAAEIPAGQELVVPAGIDAAIGPGATLTVKGKLTVANGGSLEIWEDGRLDVASGGILRVNSQAAVTGIHDSSIGRITNGGTIALMEGGEHKATVSVPITLTSGGAVYSQFDAKDLTIESAEAATLDPAEKVEGVANATEIAEGQEPVFGYRYTYKSSGGGIVVSGGSSSGYNITKITREGGLVTVNPTRPSKGTTVTITITIDPGYALKELTVTDGKGDQVPLTKVSDTEYTFSMPGSDVTVLTTFREVGTLPFGDVLVDDWFYDAVAYAYETGVMTGTTDTTFSPNQALTRGMLVTMLYRLEENPAAADGTFSDVDPSQYYADPIAWAAESGIVTGYGDGTFGPDRLITREQLATILWRYAQFKGYDVSIGEDTNILSYLDVTQVSEYAVPALQWACGAGIMEGVGEGRLAPQSTATRAQVAAMAMRFCQNVSK